MKSLSDAKADSQVRVVSFLGGEGSERKLVEMGLLPGECLMVIQNEGKGPLSIRLKGAKLAIGRSLAQKIFVKQCCQDKNV